VIWYALHGDHHADLAGGHEQSPWPATKTTVSFEDTRAASRREVISHRITAVIAALEFVANGDLGVGGSTPRLLPRRG
jgi:hypothetical protein